MGAAAVQRIKFRPVWAGAIHGHAVNVARSFFPKLVSDYDMDDLLQEAYIIFLKVRRSYPNIDNPAWFMAVFSLSLTRKYINMSARAGRLVPLEHEDMAGASEDDNYFRQVLRELPPWQKALIHQFLHGNAKREKQALAWLQQLFPAV